MNPTLALALASAVLAPPQQDPYPAQAPRPGEVAPQPGLAVRTAQRPEKPRSVRLERLSAGVPWPRGIAWVDGEIAVLARGRHRSYGGPDPAYEDHAARLYLVDPDVFEPFEAGRAPGAAVRANARVLADPDPELVHVYDRSVLPLEDVRMNRPYCTLVYDEASRNLLLCAYAGVDLGERPGFRKNPTDAIYRYDLRSSRWAIVEKHGADSVPDAELGPWISSVYYPHHDPRRNPPPHGLLNGPNGCTVAGRWLYAVGKDNHTLARYDLAPIRRDPGAPPPPAEVVLGEHLDVRIEGKVQRIRALGHSAVAASDSWLYLGFRTSNIVLRFPLREDGSLVRPTIGELIAEFEPYDSRIGRGADLWELALNARGELFVSCAREGRVWRFDPDPARPFDGNDRRKDPPTPNRPYLDLPALTGISNARISNLAFDPEDRLLFCATMSEPDLPHAGAIFRAIDLDG